MSDVMLRITTVMKEKHITGREVCKKLGIVETNFTGWKNGNEGYKKHLPEIAALLGCSVEYLTTGKESEAEHLYRAFKNAPENVQSGIRSILGMPDEK